MSHLFSSSITIIRIFLRKHWPGLIFALAIGVIIALPPVIWHFSSGYRGVEMLKTNTETHYVAQVQEVYDGYPSLGNPYLSGVKDTPYLFPPFSPNLVAFMGKALHISAIHAVMFTRLLFVTLLSFLIYLFTYFISGSVLVGIVSSTFVILGYGAIVPGQLLEFLKGGSWLPEPTFIDYGRPINPQISSVLFFAYICVFWSLLSSGEYLRKLKIVLGGLLIGAAFYTYLFTWTFCIAITATTAVTLFIFKEKRRAKDLLFILLLALGIGLPYLLHSWNISHSALYAEVVTRFGFVQRSTPEISRLVLIAISLLAVFWRLFGRTEKIFFGSIFIASLVIVNEHLVTGLYLFNHHWHWYYITPLVIIFLTILLFRVVQRRNVRPIIISALGASLVLFFLTGGITAQVQSYQKVLPEVRREQSYAGLFRWLQSGLPAGKTIFAPLPIADMIPALTNHDVYFSSTALYTLVPNKRLAHAYLAYLYLRGVPKEEIPRFIQEDEATIVYWIFGYLCSFKDVSTTHCLDKTYLESSAEIYRTITDKNFIAFLQEYPIDYIIYDVDSESAWKPQAFGLRVAWQEDGIIVYEISRKQ